MSNIKAFFQMSKVLSVVALGMFLATAGLQSAFASSLGVPDRTGRALQNAGESIVLEAALIGTVLLQRGASFALLANGSRLQEGDEIAEGVRLRQVRRDRIVVERQATSYEIRLGLRAATAAGGVAAGPIATNAQATTPRAVLAAPSALPHQDLGTVEALRQEARQRRLMVVKGVRDGAITRDR